MRALHYLPLAVLLLGGCGTQNNIWSQYAEVLRQSWRNSSGQGKVSLENAAKIPYATLAYRVDGSSEAMLVLATDTNGDQLWTAASRVVLMTRDGRIIRSVGFPHDRGQLTAETLKVPLPAPSRAFQGSYRSTRVADFPDVGLHGVHISCVATAGRVEMVIILGTAMTTRRVDEKCESRTPRWSFTDSYWADPDTGFVWQSLQHLHPSGPTVQLKILRPPE